MPLWRNSFGHSGNRVPWPHVTLGARPPSPVQSTSAEGRVCPTTSRERRFHPLSWVLGRRDPESGEMAQPSNDVAARAPVKSCYYPRARKMAPYQAPVLAPAFQVAAVTLSERPGLGDGPRMRHPVADRHPRPRRSFCRCRRTRGLGGPNRSLCPATSVAPPLGGSTPTAVVSCGDHARWRRGVNRPTVGVSSPGRARRTRIYGPAPLPIHRRPHGR